jgi:hypothetical protein
MGAYMWWVIKSLSQYMLSHAPGQPANGWACFFAFEAADMSMGLVWVLLMCNVVEILQSAGLTVAVQAFNLPMH